MLPPATTAITATIAVTCLLKNDGYNMIESYYASPEREQIVEVQLYAERELIADSCGYAEMVVVQDIELGVRVVGINMLVWEVVAVFVGYVAGESLKFFVVTDNPEYLYAVTDNDGVFFFGIKKDGSVDWQEGVPLSVKKEIARQMQAVVNSLNTEIVRLQNGKVDKVVGKSLIDAVFAGANYSGELAEFVKVIMDADDALLESIGKDGNRKFYTKVSFDGGVDWNKETLDELVEALKATGFTGGAGDWSDAASLQIPMPRFAIVNISGVESMPQTKTSDLTAYMQFWDNNGNYQVGQVRPLILRIHSDGLFPQE